jgi:hypothetical protein
MLCPPNTKRNFTPTLKIATFPNLNRERFIVYADRKVGKKFRVIALSYRKEKTPNGFYNLYFLLQTLHQSTVVTFLIPNVCFSFYFTFTPTPTPPP